MSFQISVCDSLYTESNRIAAVVPLGEDGVTELHPHEEAMSPLERLALEGRRRLDALEQVSTPPPPPPTLYALTHSYRLICTLYSPSYWCHESTSYCFLVVASVIML